MHAAAENRTTRSEKAAQAIYNDGGTDGDDAVDDRHLAVRHLRDVVKGATGCDYVIKGFTRPGELTVLFGESGSLKSFMLIDAGLTVAAGSPRWLGHRVRQGGVLFVVGEGATGLPKRLHAWLIDRGHDPATLPVAVRTSPANLFDVEGLNSIFAEAEVEIRQPVRLVIFDPLGLMLADRDESKNADIGAAFSALRQALGSTRAAVLIHHSGHGDAGRERGASTIKTNADARFIVKHDEASGVVTLGHLKAKENGRSGDLFLSARVIVLGQDDDGDDITSLVLDETTERPAERAEWKGAVKQSDQTALRELGRLWLGNGRQPVQAGRWRQAAHALGLLNAGEAEDSAANSRAFQRMVSVLREAGLIEQIGKGRFVSYAPAMPGAPTEQQA